MESSSDQLIIWANVVAGVAVVGYMYILWAIARGWFAPTERFMRIMRWICVVCLAMPIAARFQYSSQSILYISLCIVVIGGLIKFKNSKGL